MNGLIRIYDVSTGDLLSEVKNHNHHVTAMMASGSTLWSGDDKGNLVVWDFSNISDLLNPLCYKIGGHSGKVTSITCQESTIWISSFDGFISCWNNPKDRNEFLKFSRKSDEHFDQIMRDSSKKASVDDFNQFGTPMALSSRHLSLNSTPEFMTPPDFPIRFQSVNDEVFEKMSQLEKKIFVYLQN
ncbi:hypothetical protein GEMRC1_011631 [Eukaryota sp. GEM-RC1]